MATISTEKVVTSVTLNLEADEASHLASILHHVAGSSTAYHLSELLEEQGIAACDECEFVGVITLVDEDEEDWLEDEDDDD